MGMFLILYYRINSMSILKFFSSKEKYNSIITFYSIMNLDEVLHYRRSVRAYDRTKLIDPERIKHCLELATLAPNSSDMQLWEFYHITQPELLTKVSRACLDQKATSTASQIVVFVVRRDWYRKHARFVLDFERENIRRYSPKERQTKRIKDGNYTMAN